MALDDDALEAARHWADQVSRRHRELDIAESHHTAAVRRLFSLGGSVSEIALALGLSRQRVHRTVMGTATDVDRTRRAEDAVPACSFCGLGSDQPGDLVAGPTVHICRGCVVALRPGLSHDADWRTCSFCHLTGRDSGRIAGASRGMLNVCAPCLDVCDRILSDEQPNPSDAAS